MSNFETEAEYLDICDHNGNPTGKRHLRGTPLKPGEYMRAVVVCIFNPEGQLLIQQRVSEKKNWPNCWDVSVAGAVSAGETVQEAAMREVAEEIGLSIDLSAVRPTLTTIFREGFTYTFVINMDVKTTNLTLQKEEVQDTRFATKEEVLSMIEDKSFICYRKAWIDYVFDISEREFYF